MIFRVAFLGLLIVVVVAVSRWRSLRVSPDGFGDIAMGEVPAVARAFDRLRAGRRRGAIAGAVLFAVPSLVLTRSLSLNVDALLAGAAGGTALTMWWQSTRETPDVRVARLGRRTVTSLVGRGPMGLMVVTAGAALLATADWLRLHPHVSGNWTQASEGRVCATNVPAANGVALSALSAVLALAVCLAAAVRIARAGADQSIPAGADQVLRTLGARSCIGCAIVIGAAQAAGMLFLLPTVLYGPCGTFESAHHWSIDALLLGALGFLLVALGSLFRFVVTPVRFRGTKATARTR